MHMLNTTVYAKADELQVYAQHRGHYLLRFHQIYSTWAVLQVGDVKKVASRKSAGNCLACNVAHRHYEFSRTHGS